MFIQGTNRARNEVIRIKKFMTIMAIVCLAFSLAGCKKLVRTEYEKVEVNIVDEYHRGMYVTPVFNGKTTGMVTHPAVYRITVEYNGIKYTISGSNTYNKYKSKVGQAATGILRIRTYDEGTVKYDITELE